MLQTRALYDVWLFLFRSLSRITPNFKPQVLTAPKRFSKDLPSTCGPDVNKIQKFMIMTTFLSDRKSIKFFLIMSYTHSASSHKHQEVT